MIEFDPAKDAANIAKHGVSLTLAEEFDFSSAPVVVDARRDYGEERRNAFGLIRGHIYCVTFTLRGSNMRIISVRRVRAKEVRRWLREK